MSRYGSRSLVFGTVALALAGCASGSDSSRTSDDIVRGRATTGDAAVVALVLDGNAFCSGTLVSPRVVVTAAHCVTAIQGLGRPISDIEVVMGTYVAVADERHGVVEALVHPGYSDEDTSIEGAGNDIAVLALGTSARATPVRMNSEPIDDLAAGTEVRLVGYGRIDPRVSFTGLKLETTGVSGTVSPTFFRYDAGPGVDCSGDSGGPSFVRFEDGERLVGANSRGDCVTGGWHARVDVHLATFIQPFIDAHGGSAPPPDDEPGDDEPGDDEPGDDEPGDDEPGDDEPGDDEPGDDDGDSGPGTGASCATESGSRAVRCSDSESGSWECECLLGGARVGECTHSGADACSLPGSCCDAFF